MTAARHHRRARGLAARGQRGAVVGLVLLRRRRRARPRLLLAHRPPPERGRHRGRARHLAARAGLPAELRAQRRRAGRRHRARPGDVRLRAPARAVGAALRRRRAPVRARRAHRHRSGRLPQGDGRGQPALHRLGRAAGVRLRARRTASRADHYEQPGSIAGVLEVDGRRHALAGRGLRDHSWGVRDWQRVPVVALVRHGRRPRQLRDAQQRRDRRRRRDGRRLHDARRRDRRRSRPARRRRSSTRSSAASASFEARATDARGRTTTLRGRAIEVAPLRQRRDGRLTHVNEGLTEYEWEGHRGTGISRVPDADRADRAPA